MFNSCQIILFRYKNHKQENIGLIIEKMVYDK